MSFWDGNDQTPDNLAKLGPWVDGIVGTDGVYSDLYEAYVTGGWRRMIVTTGASLSADLTIAANNVCIWSPHHGNGLPELGSKRITITGSGIVLAGFGLDGGGASAGAGIVIAGTAGDIHIERFKVIDYLGAGIQFTTNGNNHVIRNSTIMSNGGDGIITSAGASGIRIDGNIIYGNGDYGVDDVGADYTIIYGNRIAVNTTGTVNPGTNTIWANLNQLV